MDREVLISEFLDRAEKCFSAGVETCESADDTMHALIQAGMIKKAKEREAFDYAAKCDACGHVEFDRDAMRAALDRLFVDLRDFCGEIYADKGQTHEPTLLASLLKKRKGKQNGQTKRTA